MSQQQSNVKCDRKNDQVPQAVHHSTGSRNETHTHDDPEIDNSSDSGPGTPNVTTNTQKRQLKVNHDEKRQSGSQQDTSPFLVLDERRMESP